MKRLFPFLIIFVFGLFSGCGGDSGGGGDDDRPNNQFPTALFTTIPTTGNAPLVVDFNATASDDPDGTITSYEWVFGDGGTGTGVTISHTYASDGTYTVTLTVTDDEGATDTDSTSVTVVQMVTTPDVAGQSQAAAEAAIVAAHLVVGIVSTANSDSVPSGDVISQNPAASTLVAQGSSVDLVVSIGPAPVMETVPDLVGLSQADAEAAIVAENLVVGAVTTANSASVPSGNVISQNPAASTSVVQGSAVDLVVSLGPAMATVPDVVGMSQADATTAVENADLITGAITLENSDTVAAGSVISQDPLDGTSVAPNASVDLVVSLGAVGSLPPDPAGVAPEIDPTVATTMAAATAFLYSGATPVQIGVSPDTIKETSVAVLRGKIMERNDDPIPGVTITILDHPEYGQTLSRDDGMFDMVVNGGGYLTIDYQKSGYLPAQRQVNVPWQDYVWLPDVVMIPLDSQVTSIDLTSSDPMQVALGSVVTDSDGDRQAVLMIPQSTTATITLPDGTPQEITTLNLRVTEYTVGDNGPESMPAQLPPTSGYTYAVEISADEALADGIKVNGKDVVFNQPVPFYVDNFLNFPVGGIVPVGYYDNDKGAWIPYDNGLIIEIVDITLGLADVDVDGDGSADTGTALSDLGITDPEREQLAALYTPGESLWRVQLAHLSTWDHNWPYGPPGDATGPELPWFVRGGEDKPCKKKGSSIIEIQNQVLGERVPVVGTPFSLNYRSNRVTGFEKAYTLDIPASNDSIPTSLKRIDVEVLVAGRRFQESIDPPSVDLSHTFSWDGMDAYNRVLQGAQPVKIRVGYVYDAVYYEPDDLEQAFASFGTTEIEGVPGRQETIIWQEFTDTVGVLDAGVHGLGSWSLDVHHAYDFYAQVLHLGSGGRRSADNLSTVLTVVAGIPGTSGDSGDGGPATEALLRKTSGAAVGVDGSLYIADSDSNRVRRVDPDGIITTVAGDGTQGFGGDGGPATEAQLDTPRGIVLGPGGSLYVADSGNNRIRRVGPDGIITTVAGDGTQGFGGDGGLATEARISGPVGIAFGPDGSLYIADLYNYRIRRVGPDGIITTVAGTGIPVYGGDGGSAAIAGIAFPYDVAVGPDGSLYIAEYGSQRIRRVGPDGIISTVAGTGTAGYEGDGGYATAAQLNAPVSVTLAPDGSLYISDLLNFCIRRVRPDGIISTFAPYGSAVDVTFGPDGNLYIAGGTMMRMISPVLPGITLGDMTVASEDGSILYHFGADGRHLRTIDALGGTAIYTFEYDSNGLLSAVEDRYGNRTTIERDANGDPMAIVSPYGQSTSLSLDANGYLAGITNPAGEMHTLGYTNGGLLNSFTDPEDNDYSYTFDDLGLLVRTDDPAGGFNVLERTPTDTGYEVSLTTAMGRIDTYSVEYLPTGEKRRVQTSGCCGQNEYLSGIEDSHTVTRADGTVLNTEQGPDPRWGMQAPVVTSLSLAVPSGLTVVMSAERQAALSDPEDPLSLENLTSSFTVNGRTHTSTFSAISGQFTTISPEGRQFVATLDALGSLTGYQYSDLAIATLTYDEEGRPATYATGTGDKERMFAFAYDVNGNVSSVSDPLSRTSSFSYDDAGHVTEIQLPDDRQILYTYDANGNVTAIAPPGRPVHVFGYTTVNQIELYDPPDVGVSGDQTQYTFNLDRQLSTIVRPDSKTVSLAYDGVGRLDTITYPRGQLGHTYDAATGQIITITTPDGGILTYSHDGLLPTSETWSDGDVAGSVETAYNADFRIAQETVNGVDAVSFQYDQDGLLTGAGEITLDLNIENGLIAGTTIGNVTTSQSFNDFAELEDYSASYNTSELYAVSYVRDKLGRITEKAETVNGTPVTYSYEYDLAGRLATASRDGISATYTYDVNGNRLSRTSGGETFTGSYDVQDRLLQYDDSTYTYTENGELLTKTQGDQTTTYDYDVFGNLISVELADGTLVEYIVDGTNRRIGKKVDGSLVQGFLYRNHLNPIAELDSGNNVVSRFIYASRLTVPDYMEKGANRYRIISDHLGSVRLVVDVDTGGVIQQIDYDEFGHITSDTNPGFQPFGFAGGLYDIHTQMVRFGVRDYDSETGRWTCKDPILFFGGDSNLYGYVLADPVNLIDPTGYVFPDRLPTWLLDKISTKQETVDAYAAGGDSAIEYATFGYMPGIGKTIRKMFGVDIVDECSKTYKEVKKTADFGFKVVGVVTGLHGLRQVAAATFIQTGVNATKQITTAGDALGLAHAGRAAISEVQELFRK